MRTRTIGPAIALTLGLLGSGVAEPCSIKTPVSPFEMVARAELILHVSAAGYERTPDDASRTTGRPESRVLFAVIEVLKGDSSVSTASLPGYLSDRDDYNDRPVPYDFVRRNGRSGSCFANTYREGAEHLLFLTKDREGTYTTNWYALAPVNEQLHSGDDAWLTWVREQLRKEPLPEPQRRPTKVSQRTEPRRQLRLAANRLRGR